jgi:hypothetical protein
MEEEEQRRRKEDKINLSSIEHSLHHEFITKVIEREAEKADFRKAIMEKTILALLYSGIVGLLYMIGNFIKDHWR